MMYFAYRMSKVILKREKGSCSRGRIRITMDSEDTGRWEPVLEVRNFEKGAEDFYDNWRNLGRRKTLDKEVVWNLEDGRKVDARCWEMMEWETVKQYKMRILSELLKEERWRSMKLEIRWYGNASSDYVFPYGGDPPKNHTIVCEK